MLHTFHVLCHFSHKAQSLTRKPVPQEVLHEAEDVAESLHIQLRSLDTPLLVHREVLHDLVARLEQVVDATGVDVTLQILYIEVSEEEEVRVLTVKRAHRRIIPHVCAQ